jgi:V8-like Glu-specific endopeptidase
MGRLGSRAFGAGKTRAVLIVLGGGLILAGLVVAPARGVAAGLATRVVHGIGHAMGSPAKPAQSARPAQPITSNARSFDGVAAVGALFRVGQGGPAQHYCTGSVVNSPAGDIVLTAAHCVTTNGSVDSPATLEFAPGWVNGKSPYGTWRVTQVYTDADWRSSQDADDDVAFLKLAPASDGVPIENVTGAETLGTGWPARTYVRVIGYPDGANQPVWCANWTSGFSPTALEFDCGGYQIGTSGSPFLADASPVSGEGTVIGVIGGYEQGGDTPSVSYSIVFGPSVTSLLRTAEAGS